MSKRRDPADAFGLSLMDVLSNALGGVILLVLIVAVTLKGNDLERRNLPKEGRQGEAYTVMVFKPSQLSRSDSIITVQIRANVDVQLRVGQNSAGVELNRVGREGSRDWMLVVRDPDKFTKDIDVFGNKKVPTVSACDSVFAIASRGSAVTGHLPGDLVDWSGKQRLFRLEPDGELIPENCH